VTPGLIELVFAYGIAFGAMNKLPDLVYAKVPAFIHRLLACAYCTGFHTGWMAYFAVSHEAIVWHHAPIWGLTSAAFSYAADTALRLAESHTHVVGEEQ
jgi:dolichyl-phosphate-mannose--protein O-mannosyl transferase